MFPSLSLSCAILYRLQDGFSAVNVRPRLYREKLYWVERSPAYSSYPVGWYISYKMWQTV